MRARTDAARSRRGMVEHDRGFVGDRPHSTIKGRLRMVQAPDATIDLRSDTVTRPTAGFAAACKPRGHVIYPPTTLVEIENTHNRAGGIIFPQIEAERICAAARERDIAAFLDGARLWNVAVASRRSLAELAAPFDLVAVALSKGLGAPGGSLLVGSRALIERCVRYRRMSGGAMRQVGIFAAAGLYALERHMERLAEDHANARLIAEER